MKLSISSEFQEFLEKNIDNLEPEFVYHYTDMEALLGILEKGELWLTDRNYMNDVYDEMYIKGISDKLWDSPNTSMLKHSFTVHDDVIYYQEDSYIFSTSTESDVANQWLCYGNGSVCIEFKRDELEEFINEFASEHRPDDEVFYYEEFASEQQLDGEAFYYEDNFLSFPVFYNEEIIGKIKKFLQEKYGDDRFRSMGENSFPNFFDEFTQANYDYHLLYGFAKQKGFSSEKEYRFLVLSNRKPCFRTRNGQLTPFIKVKDNNGKLPIKSIIIGPKNHDKYTKNAFEKLVKSYGYGYVEIKQSSLFLR